MTFELETALVITLLFVFIILIYCVLSLRITGLEKKFNEESNFINDQLDQVLDC